MVAVRQETAGKYFFVAVTIRFDFLLTTVDFKLPKSGVFALINLYCKHFASVKHVMNILFSLF